MSNLGVLGPQGLEVERACGLEPLFEAEQTASVAIMRLLLLGAFFKDSGPQPGSFLSGNGKTSSALTKGEPST